MSERQQNPDDLRRRSWNRLATMGENRRSRDSALWAKVHASATRDLRERENAAAYIPTGFVGDVALPPEVIATFDSDEEF